MSMVICTLFEGHFHYGVAALVNSLFKNGFNGDVFIGYRGDVPSWALNAKSNETFNWAGAKTFSVTPDLNCHFLPIETTIHFTNYKAQFILNIREHCIIDPALSGIFYFDPDITNKCNWKFYEQWISYGVALVHEIDGNDMSPLHPKRNQWIAVSKQLGYDVKNKLNSQINGGFIGITADRFGFLQMWNDLIKHAVLNFNFDMTKLRQSTDRSNLFTASDQDLLNLTAMCTPETISEFGPEGMDFLNGGWLMSHAVGSPKPWKKNFFIAALKGKPPSLAEKAYWLNVNGVIKCYHPIEIKFKRFSILVASFIGRFYHKS